MKNYVKFKIICEVEVPSIS